MAGKMPAPRRMPIAIAIAVVEHLDRFLIGQRPPGIPLAGLWEFPGGKINPDESPEAAAVRECREETGLNVEPLFRYPSQLQDYDHDTIELHFIACRPIDAPLPDPTPPFGWVPRSDLSHLEFPAGNRRLLQLLLTDSSTHRRT